MSKHAEQTERAEQADARAAAARAGDHHRHVRGRPQHGGQRARGPRLVRGRQPAARAAADPGRARWAGSWTTSSASRPSSTCAAGPSSPTSPRPEPSSRPTAATPGSCSSRPPTTCWSAGSRPSAGRTRCRATACSATASRRERELLRDLRGRCRPRHRHHRPQRAPARREGDLRVRGGDAGPARDGDVVRLQVRPAGRRRPGRRLPVPAQPALGPRAAAADRAGRGGS